MSCFQNQNHYQLLGVEHKAAHQDIHSAYRQIIKRIHPDLHQQEPHATEHTKAVNVAYEILTDPLRRVRYDLHLRGKTNAPRAQRHRAKYKQDQQSSGKQKEPYKTTEREPEAGHENDPNIWRPASTGNGWTARTARANLWVGHRNGNPRTVAIFIYQQWTEDPTTIQGANQMEQQIARAAAECSDVEAIRSIITKIIERQAKTGNPVCGIKCQRCKQSYHEPTYRSCYECRQRPAETEP